MTTRFAGELRLDEPQIAPPRRPEPPMPERVEVTQPYIPAIRDTPPDFARRLNGDAPSPPTPAARPAPTPAPSADTTFVEPAPASTAPPTEKKAAPAPADTTAPPKRRSLVRRVVRKIIGPDLLRKDPAPRGR